MKDFMFKGNKELFDKKKARVNNELTIIKNFIEQFSINIRHEINEESKQNLKQLFEKIQKQKAFNEVFRKTCEEAFLKTKNIHNGIEQEIEEIKADNSSRAVAGLINTDEEVRNIKQKSSNTSVKGWSFAGAEIIHGLNLSIPS